MPIRFSQGQRVSSRQIVCEAYRLASGKTVDWKAIETLPLNTYPKLQLRTEQVLSFLWQTSVELPSSLHPELELRALAQFVRTGLCRHYGTWSSLSDAS